VIIGFSSWAYLCVLNCCFLLFLFCLFSSNLELLLLVIKLLSIFYLPPLLFSPFSVSTTKNADTEVLISLYSTDARCLRIYPKLKDTTDHRSMYFFLLSRLECSIRSEKQCNNKIRYFRQYRKAGSDLDDFRVKSMRSLAYPIGYMKCEMMQMLNQDAAHLETHAP